jgi:hypothetical protein
VSRGQCDGSLRLYSQVSRPEPLLLLPSSSSVVLTRPSGPVPDPLLLRKSGSTGNRTRTSGFVDHRGGLVKPNKVYFIMSILLLLGHTAAESRHYATRRKAEVSIPNDVIGFVSVYLILPTTLWPWG